MSNNKRDSEGKFASKGMTGPIRDNPWTSAAIAAGAAGLGAFLWSRRNQLGESFSSGMDRLSDFKSERMGGGREWSLPGGVDPATVILVVAFRIVVLAGAAAVSAAIVVGRH